MFAEQTTPEPPAKQKQGRGGSMIRSTTGILRDTSAKLAESQKQHPIKVSLRFYIPAKSSDCLIEDRQLPLVCTGLIRMRIKPAQ